MGVRNEEGGILRANQTTEYNYGSFADKITPDEPSVVRLLGKLCVGKDFGQGRKL